MQDPKANPKVEIPEDTGAALIPPELEEAIWREREAALREIEEDRRNSGVDKPLKPLTSLPSVVTWWLPERQMPRIVFNESQVISVQKVPDELVEDLFRNLGKKMPLQTDNILQGQEVIVDSRSKLRGSPPDRDEALANEDALVGKLPLPPLPDGEAAQLLVLHSLTATGKDENFWEAVQAGDIVRFLR